MLKFAIFSFLLLSICFCGKNTAQPPRVTIGTGYGPYFGYCELGKQYIQTVNCTVETNSAGDYNYDFSLSGDESFSLVGNKRIGINYYTGKDVDFMCVAQNEGWLHSKVLAVYQNGGGDTAKADLYAYGFKKYDSTYLFLNKTFIDFGKVAIGNVARDTIKGVIPDSSKHYIIYSINHRYIPPFDFGSTGTGQYLGSILLAGDSTIEAVTFSPKISGNFKDSFYIYSSATQTPDTFKIILIGEGMPQNNVIEFIQNRVSLFPNPISTKSTFSFTTLFPSFTTLKIYNLLGNEVATLADQILPAGEQRLEFDASTLPSGVYYYRLQIGDKVETKAIVVAH